MNETGTKATGGNEKGHIMEKRSMQFIIASSISDAVTRYAAAPHVATMTRQPRVCCSSTQEIPAFDLEQLRASCGTDMQIRHRRPTVKVTTRQARPTVETFVIAA